MQKTKIVIALVAIAALTLTIVGLATAQIAQNQPYPSIITDPNTVRNPACGDGSETALGLEPANPIPTNTSSRQQ